jgi:hypothetical protein
VPGPYIAAVTIAIVPDAGLPATADTHWPALSGSARTLPMPRIDPSATTTGALAALSEVSAGREPATTTPARRNVAALA